jgi:hypothetical protein
MDENNRITITVCGDGGCGTFYAFFLTGGSRGRGVEGRECVEDVLLDCADGGIYRQELDYFEAGEESVDTRVSFATLPRELCVLGIMADWLRVQI